MNYTALTFAHNARITRAQFTYVLAEAKSPARDNATRLYALPLNYGLDPAVALALFGHESSFGKAGRARFTKNWGNIRKSQGRAYMHLGGFAWYHTWEASLDDWCKLIRRLYIDAWHLDNVAAALRKYAPSSDNNNPDRYARAVAVAIEGWQKL